MKYLLAIYSIIISNSIFAQTLNGIVILQNSGKKKLSGVQIISEGANQVISKADGKFTLSFAKKKPGDAILLKVEKQGYEIVNYKDLCTRLRKDDKDTLSIHMCPRGELETRRMKYYSIQEKFITRRYREDLEKLRKEKKDSWEALKTLNEQYKRTLEYAKEIANRFSTTNLDDCSQRYKIAFAAIEKGDILKADFLLTEMDNDLSRAQNEIDAANSITNISSTKLTAAKRNRKKAIDCFVLKADLYVIQFQFSKAMIYYKNAANADTTEAETQFKYAYFLHSQLQYSEVEPYYERCLRLTIKDNNTVNTAIVFDNLGSILSEKYKFRQAKEMYDKALFIKKELAEKYPDIFLPLVASTLNNLGLLLSGNNEPQNARKHLEAALAINRKLAKITDAYLPDMATTLNNLGILLSDNQEITEAIKDYEECLQIRRKLAEKNPTVYLPHVADILNNLGGLLSNFNKASQAKEMYEEALQIYRTLADKNPDTFLPDLAMILNNVAALLDRNDDLFGAKNYYAEALQIYINLAKQNPEIYLPDLARTYSNIGNLLAVNNDLVEAKKMFAEAVQIIRKLTEKKPDAWQPDLAMILHNLGALLNDNNEISEARNSYEEALQIRRKLAMKAPATWLPALSMTLNNLGSLLSDIGEITEAQKLLEEALQIRKILAKKNPTAYLYDQVVTLNNLGCLLSRNRKPTEAKKIFEEGLQITRRLVKENASFLPHLAMILNNLGNLLSDSHKMENAKEMYEEAMDVYKKLAERNPSTYNMKVVILIINIGSIYELEFQKTGNGILKSKGEKLMSDAIQRLSIFPSDHPTVKDYMKTITRLKTIFTNI